MPNPPSPAIQIMLLAAGLTLSACQSGSDRSNGNTAEASINATKAADVLNMSAEELIAYGDKRAGKAPWDADCNQAFLGDLAAARRVKDALFALPYAQRSERSDFCRTMAENMLTHPENFTKRR